MSFHIVTLRKALSEKRTNVLGLYYECPLWDFITILTMRRSLFIIIQNKFNALFSISFIAENVARCFLSCVCVCRTFISKNKLILNCSFYLFFKTILIHSSETYGEILNLHKTKLLTELSILKTSNIIQLEGDKKCEEAVPRQISTSSNSQSMSILQLN
jgi:hypothetical protein